MKPFQLSEDVLPIGEFKTHAAQVFRKLRANQRPVVITQNGKPAGVLITPEEFDQIREQERVRAAVREGLADVEAGREVDDEDLDEYFAERFGPPEPE